MGRPGFGTDGVRLGLSAAWRGGEQNTADV